MHVSVNVGCQGKSGPGKIHEVILVFFFARPTDPLHERKGDGKRNISLGWPNDKKGLLTFVNLATSAASERSFSTAQRLKTWLRSRINRRFSNLTVLNIHKETTHTVGIPQLTSQKNLPTATQTESVILVLFKYMMYCNFNLFSVTVLLILKAGFH